MLKKECKSRTNGTIEHFKCARWNDIKKRACNTSTRNQSNKLYHKKGIKLLMSKDEFYSFCENNRPKIMRLFKSGNKPTIDRIDNNGNYSLDNIQILSLSENSKKQPRKPHNVCYAKNLLTGKITEYPGFWSNEFKALKCDPASAQKIAKRKTDRGFRYKNYTFSYDKNNFPDVSLGMKLSATKFKWKSN